MTPLANVSANIFATLALSFSWTTNIFGKAFWIFVVHYTLFVYTSSFPNNTRKVI